MVHRWQCLSGIALACVVFAGLLASPSHAAAWADYDRTIVRTSRTLQRIDRMERAKPGSGKADLSQLNKSLPSNLSVTTRDHQTIEADFTWLKEELEDIAGQTGKNRAESISNAIGRLETMRSASRVGRWGNPDQTVRANAILKNVLAKNEYRPPIFAGIVQKIMMTIANLLSKIHVSEGTASVIGWIFIVIAVLVFAAVLVLLVLRFVNFKPDLNRAASTQEKRPHKVRRPSLDSLLAEAESSAAERRYRDAFRYTYLATIYLLDRAKLITYVDGSTNWEYLRALRKLSLAEQARIFQDMTLLFDELVYGKREVSEEDYRKSMSKFRILEEMV